MADNQSLQLATPRIGEAVTSNGDDFIKSRIFTIRGVQVMLSRDLATLYEVEVKHLHRQVKRNANRFPPDFVFHVSPEEVTALRCQNVTSKRGGDRYGLIAFTEQGVAMLSSVLKSERAAEVNVTIMRTFVAMRKALASVAPILARLETAERRQITDQARNEERFDTIFKAMDGGDFPPQKVFFNGKHHDAYSFAKKLVRKAEKSIVLVDGYCDDVTLDILASKRGGANVTIATFKTPFSNDSPRLRNVALHGGTFFPLKKAGIKESPPPWRRGFCMLFVRLDRNASHECRK